MQKKIPKIAINGWINLYKPYGMGSTNAVGAVKRILKPQKIGHAGTLDPLAEGVLPLALGEATKTVPYMMDARKTYEFTIAWGESRTTDDAEGEVVQTSDVRPTPEQVEAVLPQFIGVISQTPPIYSAIKVDGKRAYDLARAGEAVELKAREVEVFSLEVMDSRLRGNDEEQAAKSQRKLPAQFIAAEGSENWAQITLKVSCSKGTYVRSLARDIAQKLGTVGYVSFLKRSQVGAFDEQSTISLDFLEDFVHKAAKPEDVLQAQWLLPLSDALDDIPALTLDATAADTLRKGQFLADSHEGSALELAAYLDGKLVAIVSRHDGLIKPKRVFNC